MIGTQRNVTKLDAITEAILNVLGIASNSLYNTGLYLSRQQYFENQKAVSYPDLYNALKLDENYKIMHSQAGQQTLKSVAESFKSFRELNKKAKKGELKQKVKLPDYRSKTGVYQIVYPGQAIKVREENGHKWLEVPLGRAGKTNFFGIESITVPYPERLWNKKIKELRFVPSHGIWYIEYVYEMDAVPQVTGTNAIGIDPGLNNWISAVCTNGKSFLISGKRLKSVNQYWNKTKAGLQTAVDKQFGQAQGKKNKGSLLEVASRETKLQKLGSLPEVIIPNTDGKVSNKAAQFLLPNSSPNTDGKVSNKARERGLNNGQPLLGDNPELQHEQSGVKVARCLQQFPNLIFKGLIRGEDSFFTKRMARMTDKRNRQMRDATNKVARQVINWCLGNDVGTVVFGCNLEQKQGIDIGKRNNQNFVQIPTAKLRKRIEQLCLQHGINYVETEEAYTSRASFLDGDLVPAFGEKPEGYEFSGKRIKRGEYTSKKGIKCNADLNGAANILNKVATRLGLDLGQIGRGCLTQPVRLYA